MRAELLPPVALVALEAAAEALPDDFEAEFALTWAAALPEFERGDAALADEVAREADFEAAWELEELDEEEAVALLDEFTLLD